jgi:predicted small secreted protein
MKASVLLKSSLLTSLFVITSCATTKYSEDISKTTTLTWKPENV